MNHRHGLIAVLVAFALAAPAATATWYAHGTYEPDTRADVEDGFMWTTPDTTEAPDHRQIYFNAVPNIYFTGANPNVGGPVGTQIWPAPVQTYGAYLGVWKDCNDDGFIGAADGHLIQYRAELLASSVICPDGGEFNRDGWVFEFLWLGPGDVIAESDRFSRLVNDTKAMVWGDWGRPGVQATQSCQLNPQPAGTYGSTGGAIDYVDCILARQATRTVDAADADCGLGLCFGGRPQESDSLLNVRYPAHPFYDPYREGDEKTGLLEEYESHRSDPDHRKNSAFTAWDCSNPKAIDVRDPTASSGRGDLSAIVISDPTGGQLAPVLGEDDETLNLADEDGTYVSAPTPAASLDRPTGSYQDAINDTESGITIGAMDGGHRGCQGDATFAQGEVTLETSAGAVGFAKRSTDHIFRFSGGHSVIAAQACPLGIEFGGCESTLNRDLGIGTTHFMLYGTAGPSWTSTPNWVTDPQLVNRGTLQPDGPRYATFYARLGETATSSSVPGTAALYGAEWCDSNFGDRVVRGFDCDASHWWNPQHDPSGGHMPTQNADTADACYNPATGERDGNAGCRNLGALPGMTYHIRDIDCHDGQVAAGVPVHASLALIAGTCDRPN